MIIRSTGTPLSPTSLSVTTRTTLDLKEADRVAVQVVYSDIAPAAATFNGASAAVVIAASDSIVIAAHGYVTGLKVVASTAGTLPTGLSATNYWVIRVDATTIKLASSLANAVAGTVVDITAVGVGNSTLTPATSASNVAKLQESNDGTNWVDVASATVTISTSAGSTVWQYANNCRWISVLYTPSAGQVSLAIYDSYVS